MTEDRLTPGEIRAAVEKLRAMNPPPCWKKGCEQPFENYIGFPGGGYLIHARGLHSNPTREEFERMRP